MTPTSTALKSFAAGLLGLAVLGACATPDPFVELSARYANAVADSAALGDVSPAIRAELIGVAQESAGAAPLAADARRRANLYYLAVAAAQKSGDPGLKGQIATWGEDGGQSCRALFDIGVPMPEPDCTVLKAGQIAGAGEEAVAELKAAAIGRGERLSPEQGQDLVRAAQSFADEAVGQWRESNVAIDALGEQAPDGLADEIIARQWSQWCQARNVIGVNALRDIVAPGREAFLARDQVREVYLQARAEVETVLTSPPSSAPGAAPLRARSGDETHLGQVCAAVLAP